MSKIDLGLFGDKISDLLKELEENNIHISCRTFVRIQGMIAGA